MTVGIGLFPKFRSRTLILEYEDFYFVGAYFPNGQRDHSRVDFKLKYSYHLKDLCISLWKKSGKGVIITGDFNTAHHSLDLKNPKENLNTTGFLEIERAYIDDLIADGFIDIFRHKHLYDALLKQRLLSFSAR